ncbi:hypothetical protein [Erythrobacter sp. THAF29]|uniref:hypothetical protein n=1 Tax=Erythrobacter sp. THAF29 TaxID=2587851 RepID=UPI001267F41A|nr:hypothetical protein [Erythrobacter sp. THAF29]
MLRAFTPWAALALLSACGGVSEPDDNPTPQPTETPIPVEPDGGIGDGAGPPEDAAALAAGTIPARFHGVWDYEEGNCDPASDMRMEVSDSEMLFYESIGRVTDVKAEGDDLIVSLDMEGEGETWQQKTRFSLVGEGEAQRLHVSDGEKPKETDEYPSKRCPS